jgi:hypothetical protein
MNCSSSSSVALTSRTATRPASAGIGAALRTALRALSLHWHHYRARRREAYALDAINEMNAYLLRDIGASEQLISRAAGRKDAHRWRDVPFGLSVVLLAIAVLGTATPTTAAQAAPMQTMSKGYAQREASGVFTGQFVDGLPVYRFPSVTVTGSQKAEPSKKEAHSGQPRQTRARG